MSKTTLAIQMLNTLKLQDIVSRDELSKRLNVNLRYISVLRDELIQAGYNILTIRGKNGGYKLESNYKQFCLDECHMYFLYILLSYIRSRRYLPYKEDMIKYLEGILGSIDYSWSNLSNIFIKQPKRYRYDKNSEYINICVQLMMDAILNRKQVKIVYYDENLVKQGHIAQIYYFDENHESLYIQCMVYQNEKWVEKILNLDSIVNVELYGGRYINFEVVPIKIKKEMKYVVLEVKEDIEHIIDCKFSKYEILNIDNQIMNIKIYLKYIYSYELLLKYLEGYDYIVKEHNLF